MEKHNADNIREEIKFKFQMKCMYKVTSLTFSIPRLGRKFPQSSS